MFLNKLGNNVGNLKNYIELIMNSNINVIFFGYCGAGKTTLINKLCGSSFDVMNSTKEPYCAESRKKGDFLAIDLPPLDSDKDQLSKYNIHKTILSSIPVRMICLIVKYEYRHDTMLQQMNSLKKNFEEYLDNTLIIITQCNLAIYEKCLKTEKLLGELTKHKNIISSFSNMNEIGLNDLYDKIIKYMNKMRIIPRMTIRSINLIDNMNTFNYNSFIEEIDNFTENLTLFEDKLKEYESNELVQRALFFVLESFKFNFLKKITLPLVNNINNSLDIEKIILELISFSKNIKGEFLHLIKSFKVGLQLSTKNEDKDKGIKKCPYCGTLWTKFNGPTYIICGKRGTPNDSLPENTKNYKVKFVDNKFIIEEEVYKKKYNSNINYCYYNQEEKDTAKTKKNEFGYTTNPCLLKPEEKKRNETLEKLNQVLIQPVGCITRFSWENAEDCTDEVVAKLKYDFDINYTEFYSDIFYIEEYLKEILSLKDKKTPNNIIEDKIKSLFKEDIIEKNSSI